jgi:8-oxo-dGTP pyrophosphatase MutT (NUDIX family)
VSKREPRQSPLQSPLYPPTGLFLSPSQLRKLKTRVQVAAVCFRISKGRIEFLLVRTDRGRWTFPKGGAESGLTHAQSAALEAFEEAGVHGRMEEACFASYVHGQRGAKRSGATPSVHAHLCEVLCLSRTKEPHRRPTWFSPEKTKRRLQRDRAPDYAAELIRVVDLAVARIRSLGNGEDVRAGFEAFDDSAAANTITIESRPSGAVCRVAPGLLSPRWSVLSDQPANWRLLQAASPSAGTKQPVHEALVHVPRLTSRSGDN